MRPPDPRWLGLPLPALSAAVVGLSVLLLVLPVPAVLLELMLLANFAGAAALLLSAARARGPRALPQLPALLLLGMVLRLGLVLSAVRLVLTGRGAGPFLRLSGDLVLSGDLAVSATLLLALFAAQYLVVARGGERVAEVAARFALDALPGQQQAIEADLRGGALLPELAQARRRALLSEAQLYGALDGALRFVRGDAAAGLLILLLGVGGGLLVGVREGLDAEGALARYGAPLLGAAVLTQLPALLLSLSASLVLSRGAGAAEDGGAEAAPAEAADAREPSREALVIEAGAALGLSDASVAAALSASAAELGLPLPPARLRVAGPGRRLALRLYGTPLHDAELTEGEIPFSILRRELRAAAPELLGLDEVQRLLTALGQERPALLRETVPRRAELPLLAQLLRQLAREGVLPLDLRAVLEALSQVERPATEPLQLTEQVRGHLGLALLAGPLSPGRGREGAGLRAVVIEPEVEEALRDAAAQPRRGRGDALPLEPELCDDIVAAAAAARAGAADAVLLCHGEVRRHLSQLLRQDPAAQPVLAYGELPPRLPVTVIGRLGPGGFVPEEG